MITSAITYFIVGLLFLGCLRLTYKAWRGQFRDDVKPKAALLFVAFLALAWFVAWIGGI